MDNFEKNLFAIFIILFTGYTSCSGQLRGYNQECYSRSEEIQCDYSKFLTCNVHRCDCENPATLIFDPVSGSCVTRANESCYLEESWSRGGDVGRAHYALSSVKTTRKVPCVANAVCDEMTKKCICFNQMVANDMGHCVTPSAAENMPHFNKRCSNNDKEQCEPNTGLKCVDGLCKCGVDYFQYFNGSKCISRIDGPCQSSSDCTPSSDCIKREVSVHGQCRCLSGFMENEMGRCSPGYGQACNVVDMPCSKLGLLKCVNGKCQCSDDLQIYDKVKHGCSGLVGAHCRWAEPPPCIVNAFCFRGNNGAMDGVCRCVNGFQETGNRTCVPYVSNVYNHHNHHKIYPN